MRLLMLLRCRRFPDASRNLTCHHHPSGRNSDARVALCATNVRVFGSVARGEARPTSDIDLLIKMDATRSLLDYVALMQDLEDLLGHRIDLVIEPDLHPTIRERVLAEAIPV